MKYEKNQYTEGFSICGLIIAGAFFFWGITTLITGGWWGIIFIGIGIAISLGLIRAIVNKKKLRNAVKYEFESNPNATVEEISKSTGISKKDVQAIILDLKMSGELKGKFSSKTGQLIAETESKRQFCPSCGAQIEKEGAQFCNYCGVELK
ncbi:MAG: zinc ribbon domain-containing protein [Promethearchaeota archaeon]